MRRVMASLALVGQALLPALAPVSASAAGLLSLRSEPLPAPQVVDRIVARVEDDIILLSELRELGRYQQLLGEPPASDDRLLRQLIEQWIVNTEATVAHLPQPSEAEVKRELERVEKQFASPDAYRERLRGLGLTEAAVRRLVERQLYLLRYLDYKFRPAAQVDAAAIEKYYREQLTPGLAARGQPAPALEGVQDQIRELLTQREITERAARWLDEAKSRLKIEFVERGNGS